MAERTYVDLACLQYYDGKIKDYMNNTGNAATATKLARGKTIGISGGATGTATSFDGSENITIPVTALDVSKASAGTLAVARGGTGLTSLDTFVRTTGNQTIAGTKTFSAEIMVNKGDKPAAGALSHVFGVTYQNTGGTQTHTAHPISVIGNSNADNNYNTGVRLGSLNGTTVVSAGESGGSFCTKLSKFDDENLYLEADGEVHVYVKCANDVATYAGPIKLSGSGNASGGTTSITATTFIGALTGNCSGSSGSCTGNAATATKATQDSAGNNINTTYIKGLSVSGKTITYTKGNGTTGTITTQDTTYSAATESAAGLMSAADKKKLNGMTAGAKAFYIKYTGSSQISCTASTWKTYTASSDGAIRIVKNYSDGGQDAQIRLTSSSGTQIFTAKHANQFNTGLGWAYIPAKNGVTYAFYTTNVDTFKFYFHTRE